MVRAHPSPSPSQPVVDWRASTDLASGTAWPPGVRMDDSAASHTWSPSGMSDSAATSAGEEAFHTRLCLQGALPPLITAQSCSKCTELFIAAAGVHGARPSLRDCTPRSAVSPFGTGDEARSGSGQCLGWRSEGQFSDRGCGPRPRVAPPGRPRRLPPRPDGPARRSPADSWALWCCPALPVKSGEIGRVELHGRLGSNAPATGEPRTGGQVVEADRRSA